MRILRAAFFLSVIAVLAPSPPESEVQKILAQGDIIPTNYELISAAGNTASDIAQFCQRQPGVCQAANYIVARLEAKAKYSVRQIYEWANDSSTGNMANLPADQAAADDLVTGSTLKVAEPAGDAVTITRSTLTALDMLPPWRSPALSKG